MSELTAEQVRVAIFNGSSYASYDGVKYYAVGIDMQAIADELNTRAERTCRLKPFDVQSGELVDGICSRCSAYMHDQMCYCPKCGAKVVGE